MKKVLLSILSLALCLLPLWSLGAQAAEEKFSVYDWAGLLTQEENAALNRQAQALEERYGCGVYILTTQSLEGKSPWQFHEELYRQLDLGAGEERSGVSLLLSMEERDYDLLAYGWGNEVFTDYGKELLSEDFLDDFGEDDYNEGFQDYLAGCEEFLEQASLGTPVDVGYKRPRSFWAGLGISALGGVLGALGVCTALQGQLKSAKIKQEADDYCQGGLNLNLRQDLFLRVSRSRTKIQQASSSSSSHSGGTRVNSGGFSHRSGKF